MVGWRLGRPERAGESERLVACKNDGLPDQPAARLVRGPAENIPGLKEPARARARGSPRRAP